MIGEAGAPLNPAPGQVAREHYAYTKEGSCCLLASIEPLTGARRGKVYDQPTKREYALFLRELSLKYPDAHKIRLVQDNLNTHDFSALYETFAPEEAFALAQRFEFYFTPQCASWLNMIESEIEIEFSPLSRGCLNRRIPTREQLEREVLALVREREQRAIKINWQFSIEKTRNKFQRRYEEAQTHKTT